VLTSTDSRVLRGKAERVVAHRVENRVTGAEVVAHQDITQAVVRNVSHMGRPAGVREHHQYVLLWLFGVGCRLERPGFPPAVDPLQFYGVKIVFSGRSSSPPTAIDNTTTQRTGFPGAKKSLNGTDQAVHGEAGHFFGHGVNVYHCHAATQYVPVWHLEEDHQ